MIHRAPDSAMFEFPFSMAWGHPPRLWANLTEVAQRDGVATYDYVIQGFPPANGRIIASSRITAPSGARLTEKFESVDPWKVRCFVQGADGKSVAGYLVSYRGNQFLVEQTQVGSGNF